MSLALGSPAQALIWLEPHQVEVPAGLQAAVGGHPLVAAALAQRGLLTPQAAQAFLNPEHYQPSPGGELPDMAAALERLEQALRRKERIWVWGDFDVDGQTATTILVSALQDLGGQVRCHIPVRAVESHGLNLPWLERILAEGADLLLTCDTGVTAFEALDFAAARGLEVIVTDHHDLAVTPDGIRLPQALAVVNPKRLPEQHALASLPGAGVAYMLVEALYARAGQPSGAAGLLDLAALGIVADLALLRGEARYLVQRGLQTLRLNQRLGLKILLEVAEQRADTLTEEHIGFVIAPRLNALGRLGDANPAVELLTTQDTGRVRGLVYELENLNAYRRLITNQIFQGAQAQIEADRSLLDAPVLVLAHPQWEAGVLGLVASRLVERYHRPAILLKSTAAGQETALAHGSARSIAGLNITAAIARHADLLVGFGGHPMAAGLSLPAGNLPEFRRRLERTVQELLGAAAPQGKLQLDGYVTLNELTLELVADLERLAPFGLGNPAPVLAVRDLRLVSVSAVGKTQEHLLVTVEDPAGASQRLIWWQGAGLPLPEGRFDLALNARAASYKGQPELQLVWVDARSLASEAQFPGAEAAAFTPQIVDYRRETQPLQILERLQGASPGLQVWAEPAGAGPPGAKNRFALAPGADLVIWTSPPGADVLRAVLNELRPPRLFLFCFDPGLDEPAAFLARLAGLVKHGIAAKQGRLSVSALAAAAAQRPSAVAAGLEWLQARGDVVIEQLEGDEAILSRGGLPVPGSADPSQALQQTAVRLKALLGESAAFRRHYAAAPPESLLRLAAPPQGYNDRPRASK